MPSTTDPRTLSSWRDSAARGAITGFVEAATREGSDAYLPPAQRVAVFDNDGTLWCEKPVPIQADFLMRRIGVMAQADASLRSRQPWKSVYERDFDWLGGAITKHYNGDDADLKEMAGGLLQAYQGATIEDFQSAADAFLHSGRHPTLQRSYLDCTYAPMVELLRYLESNGFTNYIASGGGRDFMRPITESVYGIPPERVVGTTVDLDYDAPRNTIVHKPSLDVFDDGPAKPVRVWSRVGQRPVIAAGNSNGDIEMLQFAAGSPKPALRLLVLHDDGDREFSYTTGAERALDAARSQGWSVVSMKDDWTRVFDDQSA